MKDDNTMEMIDTEGIARIIGVSRRHVTERVTKEPTFPAPVINLSRKTRRWSREQVMAWLTAGRQSARPTPGSSSAGVAAGRGAR
jgi:predicted DNA-binding transcriptional regulator AlpA